MFGIFIYFIISALAFGQVYNRINCAEIYLSNVEIACQKGMG